MEIGTARKAAARRSRGHLEAQGTRLQDFLYTYAAIFVYAYLCTM